MSEPWAENPYTMDDYYRDMGEVKKSNALVKVEHLLNQIDKLLKRIDVLELSSGSAGASRVNPSQQEA